MTKAKVFTDRIRLRRMLKSVLALALALAGCGTVGNAREAQDEKKAIPGERTPTAEELGLPSSGSVTLEQVVLASLTAQPSIVQARRNAESAQARVGEAEAAYWPQVSTGPIAQYRQETVNSTGKNPQTNNTHPFQAFGFQVSWLLFDFGRTPALVRQQAKAWLAAQADLRTARVSAAFTARSAYFNLEKQRALLEVAQETVSQFQKRLDQVNGFVAVGTKTPYDLTKAQVDLGTAKLNEIKTRDAVRIASAQLASAVGLAELTEWTPEGGAPLPPFTLTFEEAWEQARKHQPALAAAAARVEAASALVDAQIAALFPTVSFSAGYTASGFTFPLAWNWQYGPNLNWILFDGFQNLYTIDEAAAELRASRAAHAQVEQQVFLDVRTAWVSLEDARERLDLTALTVKQNEENLDLAQGRYQVGKATAVDLTDAQVLLAQAKSDRVQARADYDTAVAQLWKALGLTFWNAPP